MSGESGRRPQAMRPLRPSSPGTAPPWQWAEGRHTSGHTGTRVVLHPLQHSARKQCRARVYTPVTHGVMKSQTRLSDFTFTFHFHALEKEMATYSSVLAWRIPGTREPGGLPSMGSQRVRHD